MYKSIGIIPAAGQAQRFGGVQKELLPSNDGIVFMNHAVIRLSRVCDIVIVVTNKDKVQSHMEKVKNVLYVEQNNSNDLLGAVQSALKVEAMRYHFTMPDTVINDDVFVNAPLCDGLSLGLFETSTPERFGCLVDGVIYDKNSEVFSPANAWGVLTWSAKNNNIFYESDNFCDALNKCIQINGYKTWNIKKYYDIGSIKNYIEYLKNE